jgi:uncharacterized protein YbcV (DUF1398 family)
MDANLTKVAQTCLDGAESGAMTFPQIVGTLIKEGFEGYAIDFRRATSTYYLSEQRRTADPPGRDADRRRF